MRTPLGSVRYARGRTFRFGWMGWWGTELPKRYPWLSAARNRELPNGSFTDPGLSPSWTPDEKGEGPLFLLCALREGPVEAGDPQDHLTAVLAFLTNEDEHVYWAARLPERPPA